MDPLRYTDTRGLTDRRPTFSEVVLQGLAEGGGLYVPESLPRLSLQELVELAELPYAARAARIFRAMGVDLPGERIDALLARAYAGQFDQPEIAPLRQVSGSLHVLELWHGPTAAFKDMALQAMPLFFSAAVQEGLGAAEDYLILVATSGDTGKAALEGFADRERTGIVVLYPAEGVSDLQRLQMVTQEGANVGVLGVRGNFDDCQAAVKAVFADGEFREELLERHGTALSSANSINWGRLLPQVVYYASAYADLVSRGTVGAGDPIDFAVPTGNFGNILAGYYAREMGVPVSRLICASNENRVLADFLASGTYDRRGREFTKTPSPSMDILVSSNLERALYQLSGDPERVGGWMGALQRDGCFTVDDETFARFGDVFVGGWVSNEESLQTIRQVHAETGYLLDPHTAVAWRLAEARAEDRPVVVVGTAHWAKFGQDVFRALSEIPAGAPLPPDAAELSAPELLERVLALAPGESIPASLANLGDQPVRFDGVISGTTAAVEDAVRRFLAGAPLSPEG